MQFLSFLTILMTNLYNQKLLHLVIDVNVIAEEENTEQYLH